MAQKRIIRILAVSILIVFLAMFFVGCNLIFTDNKLDMQQVVADVNLQNDSNALKESLEILEVQNFDENQLNGLELANTTIIKRDLLSAYLSYGYQQVASMGLEAVFDAIMKNLTESRLNLQLAMLYYLYKGNLIIDTTVMKVTGDTGYTASNGTQVTMQTNYFGDSSGLSVAGFMNKINKIENDTTITDETRRDLKKVVASYQYFITEREENYILNTVNAAINAAIDNYEKLELNLGTSSNTEDRTTPTNANQTNLYNSDKVMGIYTGLESDPNVAIEGYTKLKGSTAITRSRAYAQFIAALVNNGLIERGENYADITSLNYYLIECISQYESLLVTKFSATIATLQTAIQTGVQAEYDRLVTLQQMQSAKDFVSTMDAITDSTAIVATPQGTFGYMYNLLIPFSAAQSAVINGYKTELGVTTPDKTPAAALMEYYKRRNTLAKGIVATDQRGSWINGSTNYSFNASQVNTSYAQKMAAQASSNGNYFKSTTNANATNQYLFFNENFAQYGRAEGLMRYAGLYAYNGTVIEKSDGTYLVNPNNVPIENFVKNEFEGYLNYILGNSAVTASNFKFDNSFTTSTDYSFAIVYENSVSGLASSSYYGVDSNGDYGKNYKAHSAISELVFAYSTDTGSLNKPYGYAMAAGVKTEYVPEFEYAGNQLLTKAEGSYMAVVTDFGIHIMYLARKYDNTSGAKSVETFNQSEIGTAGTFSNFFYNATVNTVIGTFNSGIRGRYMEKVNTNSTVKLYKNRYKDLYGR